MPLLGLLNTGDSTFAKLADLLLSFSDSLCLLCPPERIDFSGLAISGLPPVQFPTSSNAGKSCGAVLPCTLPFCLRACAGSDMIDRIGQHQKGDGLLQSCAYLCVLSAPCIPLKYHAHVAAMKTSLLSCCADPTTLRMQDPSQRCSSFHGMINDLRVQHHPTLLDGRTAAFSSAARHRLRTLLSWCICKRGGVIDE